MAKTLATHSGTCQACGRLQKLPGGVLSKHGYTVESGFFSGVCRGSGYLPFEVSYDQVARYTAEAQAERNYLASVQAAHRASVENVVQVHVFVKSTRKGSVYTWHTTEVKAEDKGKYTSFTVNVPDWRTGKTIDRGVRDFGVDYHADTIEKVIAALHEIRAASYDWPIATLDRYIAWQTARIATWKPGALFPVGAKGEGLGFNAE